MLSMIRFLFDYRESLDADLGQIVAQIGASIMMPRFVMSLLRLRCSSTSVLMEFLGAASQNDYPGDKQIQQGQGEHQFPAK